MKNFAKNAFMLFGFLFALFMLILGLKELRTLMAGAEPSKEPVNIQTTGVTSNSATVVFETEKPVSSLVSYGTSADNLSLFSTESQQTASHSITLSYLAPNTTYYYTVKIAEKTYDNNGQPYSFTTKPGSEESSGAGDTFIDSLDPQVFKQKFGSSDSDYDLNNDGVVNSTDYLIYLKKTQEE